MYESRGGRISRACFSPRCFSHAVFLVVRSHAKALAEPSNTVEVRPLLSRTDVNSPHFLNATRPHGRPKPSARSRSLLHIEVRGYRNANRVRSRLVRSRTTGRDARRSNLRIGVYAPSLLTHRTPKPRPASKRRAAVRHHSVVHPDRRKGA